MRGLVLAAGRGSRLGPATDDRPKGLVEVGGRPLVAWQLAALRAAGAGEVALVRGHRGEAFDGLDGVTLLDNPRWATTNSVASLERAGEWLAADDCLVTYSDLVYPAAAPRALAAVDAEVAVLHDPRWLALWRRRFDDPLEDAETFLADDAGYVVEIGGLPTSVDEPRGQYMGLFRLAPAGAARLLARHRALPGEERDRQDVTALLRASIAAGERVRAVPYDGWWCEVDSARDLAVAEAVVAEDGA